MKTLVVTVLAAVFLQVPAHAWFKDSFKESKTSVATDTHSNGGTGFAKDLNADTVMEKIVGEWRTIKTPGTFAQKLTIRNVDGRLQLSLWDIDGSTRKNEWSIEDLKLEESTLTFTAVLHGEFIVYRAPRTLTLSHDGSLAGGGYIFAKSSTGSF